ncbi:unnamed protein product [Adineta steineri]|uniref:EGF-like domain-containing protein n=1 Tax=Adineta steineri TaxID=433720 RepID=A0A815ITZ3_9BILA|nr:unnamed protein product [Adineta steineri]CAF1604705.1 unnamed protein product [Adineta steineri]
MHLKCYRGPEPSCLDWREICDGKIDCLDGNADEENCYLLEINECGKDEYRCRLGMCISSEFFSDDPFNPECLDGTDECKDSSKCISFHRLLDGVRDCANSSDEKNNDSCLLNDSWRFKCPSEDRCISPLLIRNGEKNCANEEDEMTLSNFDQTQQVHFPTICDGFTDSLPINLSNNETETDETNCEHWSCSNIYTRCDNIWNCRNGEDELNCQPTKCNSREHLCLSSNSSETFCLPVEQAGDGIVDCRGAMDERHLCRLGYPTSPMKRYRCWNSNTCILVTSFCTVDDLCPLDDNMIDCSSVFACSFQFAPLTEAEELVCNLDESRKVTKLYFRLGKSSDHLLISDSHLTRDIHSDPSLNRQTNIGINYHLVWYCNRGILVQIDSRAEKKCLCPPSYYGNRCEFQSERISLTIQFKRSIAAEWNTIFNILCLLIDLKTNEIITYEQFSYISSRDCGTKFNIYLLYDQQPKINSRNYSVRIDVYERIHLDYRASWLFSVPFYFLPVNRLAFQLSIPNRRLIVMTCSISCIHGECVTYVNDNNTHFCRCYQGWSGLKCSIRHHCDCSSLSLCIGSVKNTSICICSVNKFGPRCYIPSFLCNCKNGGTCIPNDERLSDSKFRCICPEGFAGDRCEQLQTRIIIAFHNDILIPSHIFVHLVTVGHRTDPIFTTILQRIPLDWNNINIFTSIIFHLSILEFDEKYYLIFLDNELNTVRNISKVVTSSDRCPHVTELFNSSILDFPLIRSIKYYYIPCRDKLDLSCFYDDRQMCLCTKERHANCMDFINDTKFDCQGYNDCENGGHCFQDHSKCPPKAICSCADCYFGRKCSLTTRGYGFAIDPILAYQIRPNSALRDQSFAVHTSIAITIIIFFVGIIGNLLSLITFKEKISYANHY